MKPGLEEAGNILIAAYESLDRFEEAAALIGKQRCWGMSLDGASLQQALQRGGREGYLRERLAQMQRHGPGPSSASFAFAHGYVRLGEFDQALDHLERMVEDRAGGSVFLGIDAALSPLRGTPRYDALIKRIGAPLPQMV
jgi:hypothetical protein